MIQTYSKYNKGKYLIFCVLLKDSMKSVPVYLSMYLIYCIFLKDSMESVLEYLCYNVQFFLFQMIYKHLLILKRNEYCLFLHIFLMQE